MTRQPLDVVVVGNGVIGLSVALALAEEQPTATIGVVGPTDRRYGATPAAGAMLGCFGEVTAAGRATAQGRRKHDLALAARDMWPTWLERLESPAPIVTARETVVLLNSVGSADVDSANFAAIEAALREAEEPYSEIAISDVEWLDPDPNSRSLRALRIPAEGAVDSAALLGALTSALDRRGVTFVDAVATGLRVTGDRVDGVKLEDSVLPAGTVVVAAGAASGPLIESVPRLAARVPKVVSGCGVSALVDTADGTAPRQVLRTPNRAFACGLHVVPRGSGTVYVGATNEVEFAPRREVTISEFNFLTSCAVHQMYRGLNHSQVRAVQVGNRPVAIDGWPLIGATSVSGLWILTGTYRDGLHMSPLLATHLAREITGRPGLVDLDEFRPEREPISAPRDVVLDEVVKHTLATGHEGPWVVDPGWPVWIADVSRGAFARLIDSLGGAYVPPPEVLTVLLKSTPDAIERVRKYYETVYTAWH